MPFDSAFLEQILPPLPDRLPFATGHDGLRRLALELRRPMPAAFTWDFRFIRVSREKHSGEGCGTVGCAIGLAAEIWPAFRERLVGCRNRTLDDFHVIAETFDISIGDAFRIFGNGANEYRMLVEQITPINVADKIDEFLTVGLEDDA